MTVPDLSSDRIYTYADYADWDEDQRWELVEGVPYLMSAPGIRHQTILGELHLIVGNFLKNSPCRVFFAPCDVLFPESGEDEKDVKNVFQPDLMVICDSAKIKEKYIWGAPDWVVEVLSVYDSADEVEVSALPGLKIALSEILPSIKRVKEDEGSYQSVENE
jgi:Uma2 family endonuclease